MTNKQKALEFYPVKKEFDENQMEWVDVNQEKRFIFEEASDWKDDVFETKTREFTKWLNHYYNAAIKEKADNSLDAIRLQEKIKTIKEIKKNYQ